MKDRLVVHKTFNIRDYQDPKIRVDVIKYVIEELGIALAHELYKHDMISINSSSEEEFYTDRAVIRATLDVDRKEVEIKESPFYKWCYKHKPEYIFDYLFNKDKIDEA